MKKPLFNNFFGCMSLETGGKIIAWCTLVGGSVGVFVCIFSVIAATLGIGLLEKSNELYDQLKTALIILIIIYTIIIIYLAILIAAGVFLLQGIGRHLHTKMIFMLVMLVIGVVVDFLTLIASADIASIIRNIIIAVFTIYIFLTVLSLYQKVKIENEQGNVSVSNNQTAKN